jgi:hypothetical protein
MNGAVTRKVVLCLTSFAQSSCDPLSLASLSASFLFSFASYWFVPSSTYLPTGKQKKGYSGREKEWKKMRWEQMYLSNAHRATVEAMNIAESLFGQFMNWTALVNKTTTFSSPKLYPKPPCSGAERHREDQVTSWLHFVSTDLDFAQI